MFRLPIYFMYFTIFTDKNKEIEYSNKVMACDTMIFYQKRRMHIWRKLSYWILLQNRLAFR